MPLGRAGNGSDRGQTDSNREKREKRGENVGLSPYDKRGKAKVKQREAGYAAFGRCGEVFYAGMNISC